MGIYSPRSRSLKAKHAAETRFHPDVDHTELKRELAASKLEDAARDIVANWPPLTQSQIDRIAGLLRAGGASE